MWLVVERWFLKEIHSELEKRNFQKLNNHPRTLLLDCICISIYYDIAYLWQSGAIFYCSFFVDLAVKRWNKYQAPLHGLDFSMFGALVVGNDYILVRCCNIL